MLRLGSGAPPRRGRGATRAGRLRLGRQRRQALAREVGGVQREVPRLPPEAEEAEEAEEAQAEGAEAEGAEGAEEVEAEDIPIVQEVRGEDEQDELKAAGEVKAPPKQGCGGERCAAAEPRKQQQQQEGGTPQLARAQGGGPEPSAPDYDATGRPTGAVTSSPAEGVDGAAAAVPSPTKQAGDASRGGDATADAGACGATPKDWSGTPSSEDAVVPMTCGVLLYVHTGDAAGSAAYLPPAAEEARGGDTGPMGVSKWLYQAARNADFEWFDLYGAEAAEPRTPLQDWPEFRRLQASVFNGTKPRLAVQVHANVPGIGDALWDLYLHPWQHFLQRRGCDLRLTTVLRAGRARLKADYDARARPPAGEGGAAGAGAAAGGADLGGGGADFCAFAAEHANPQTKYLLSGSPPIWPAEIRRLDPAADALLLPRARKVLKEMALVGQAEQLDWYLQLLRATLGLPRHKLSAPSAGWASAHGGGVSKDWSSASPEEQRCLADAAAADDELYMHFCKG